MSYNPDFKDLLQNLCDVGAKFLVVGAYAVVYYTEPRFTKDLDIWIEADIENARKVYEALKRFGAPLSNLSPEDLANPELVYQVGVEPNRIDILMGIDGVQFTEAWKSKQDMMYGDIRIHIIGIEDLIKNKQAVGRPQDQLDLEKLVQCRK